MRRDARWLVYALFLLSGTTALVYQVTWLRNLMLIFGASYHATSIVLASFMAGLALGGFVFGRRSQKVDRPLRLYGLLEIGIAVFAAVLPALLGLVDAGYVAVAARSETVTVGLTMMRVALAFGVLVVPTFFMGATLPVLTRFLVTRQSEFGTRLAWLYGINTLGAAVGAIAAGFLLIPTLGVWHTQLLAVAVNLLIGAAAVAADARLASAAPGNGAPDDSAANDAEPGAAALFPLDASETSGATGIGSELWPLRMAFWGTAVSGFCALALEVLWTRAITLAVGSTTYSFTVMLCAFLVGIWLGSWLHAALPIRRISVSKQLGVALVVIGLSSAAVSVWIPRLPELMMTINFSLFGELRRVRPGTTLLVAFFVMLLPSVFMGMAFPLAGEARAQLSRRFGESVGDTVALNTCGSILGSLAAGFVLIPALGLQRSLLLVAAVDAAYGVAVLAAVAATRPAARRSLVAAVATGLVACILAIPALVPAWDYTVMGAFTNNQLRRYVARGGSVDVEAALGGSTVLYYREGRGATISVVERNGRRAILVNGKAVASDYLPDMQIELLLGHIPALLHPDPRSALVVGLGAGVTLGAMTAHGSLEELVLVEIEPAVLDGTRIFGDVNDHALDDPRLEIVIQDGRNFLKTTNRKFDVITADPIHPWAAGAVYLYTDEYYALAAKRLNEGGIMCQWWPAGDLSNADFRSAVTSFAANFEHLTLWQSSYDVILIGSNAPIQVDLERLARRLREPAVAAQLGRIGLAAPLPFMAEMALGDAGVRAYTEGGILNTDDNLYLEFSSPLNIGIPEATKNILSVEEHRESPLSIISGITPFFDSVEEADRVLRRYQDAKVAVTRTQFETRFERFAQLNTGLKTANSRLRGILRELPDYDPARAQLATNLAQLGTRQLQKQQLRQAVISLEESLSLASDRPHPHHTLGVAHARLGEYEAAIANFERALELRPWYWVSYDWLSAVLMETGRYPEAVATVRAGLALDPEHERMNGRLTELLVRVDAGLPPG